MGAFVHMMHPRFAVRAASAEMAEIPWNYWSLFARVQTLVARGLDRLRPVRQLVCLGETLEIRPSSGLARGLRPQEQPDVARATPPPVCRHLRAQAVHAGARDRCGREHDDL